MNNVIYRGEHFEEFPVTYKDARKILKKCLKRCRQQDRWAPWHEAVQILLYENKSLREEVREAYDQVKWNAGFLQR